MVVPTLAQDPDSPEPKIRSIGGYYSIFGWSEVVDMPSFAKAEGIEETSFTTFGFIYLHSINQDYFIEASAELSRHKVTVRSARVPDRVGNTGKDEIGLLNIPVSIRYRFLKYIFIHGGLNFSFDWSKYGLIDRQSGLGFQGGIGGQYDFQNGLSLFLSPYFKTYNLLSFRYGAEHQALIESGVRLGLIYNLKKIKEKQPFKRSKWPNSRY